MRKSIVMVFLLLAPFLLHSEEGVDRQSIEELLEVSDTKSMIDSMYAEMDKMFKGMAAQLKIKESEQHVFDKFMKKMFSAMKAEMSWEKMKEPVIEIYMRNYTKQEISEILAFYKTETGKSLVKKMPIVMRESMQVSQSMFMEFMPTIQQLAQEMKAELTSVRSGNK